MYGLAQGQKKKEPQIFHENKTERLVHVTSILTAEGLEKRQCPKKQRQ